MKISEEKQRSIVRKAILTEMPVIVDAIVNQVLQEQDREDGIGETERPAGRPISYRPIFDEEVMAEAKKMPLEHLGLSSRASNPLVKRLDIDIRTVADLYRLRDTELLAFRRFGKNTLAEVHEALRQFEERVKRDGQERESNCATPR